MPTFNDKSVQGIIDIIHSELACFGTISDKSIKAIIAAADAQDITITDHSVQGIIDALSGFSCTVSLDSLLYTDPVTISEVSAQFFTCAGATNSCLYGGIYLSAIPGMDIIGGARPNNDSTYFVRWGPQCSGYLPKSTTGRGQILLDGVSTSSWKSNSTWTGNAFPTYPTGSWKTVACNPDGSDKAIVLDPDSSGSSAGQFYFGYPASSASQNSSVILAFMLINGAAAYTQENAGRVLSYSELEELLFTRDPAPAGVYRYDLGWSTSTKNYGASSSVTHPSFTTLKFPITPYS